MLLMHSGFGTTPPMFKRLSIGLFALLFTVLTTLPCAASAYDAHPKLVVILVIDQFRENYLEKYRTDFKGEGFNLFLDHGAYFPDCYFDYANLTGAAGSATIGTGAYSDGHGIAANQWWDLSRNAKRPILSVEDPRYSIVGLPANAPESARQGVSPRNLLATTLGDELRLATQGQAKLFGVSLKDRSAILLSGHTANGAFWIDPKTGTFVTSTYYMPTLPDWAAAFNQSDAVAQARTAAGVPAGASFFASVAPTDAAIQYELHFAEALIQGENLGTGNVTDVLTISISSTDILGDHAGPDSPEQHQLIDQLDGNLDEFFRWLDHNVPGGLRNVWMALSADHGITPIPSDARKLGIPAANIDLKRVISALNTSMNGRFSPGEHLEYLLPDQELPYISLNIPMFQRAGINELEGERAIQDAIPAAMAELDPSASRLDSAVKPSVTRVPPQPQAFRTYTRLQMAAVQPGLPPTEFGRSIAHSYSANGGWYVMLIPEAYQIQGEANGTSHFSAYSYDSHVPLAFYGSTFTPGTYRGRVGPVDLAATLAAVLEINQPSASIGRILDRAIKTESELEPKRVRIHRRKRRSTTKTPDDSAVEPSPPSTVNQARPPISGSPAHEISPSTPAQPTPAPNTPAPATSSTPRP